MDCAWYFSKELFQFLIDYLDEWRKHYPLLRFWLGPFPIFLLYTPEGSEVSFVVYELPLLQRRYRTLHLDSAVRACMVHGVDGQMTPYHFL